MTTPPKRGRGRPRSPEVDGAILRAALDAFLDGGVEGASIEQIAKRAGVGKLTVYRRWSSKEELIARAIEAPRDEIPGASPEDVEDVPLEELVEQVIPGFAEAIASSRFRAMVARVFGSSASNPALMETYWEHYVVPRRRLTGLLLERAVRDGLLAEDTDTEVLIDMMVGSVLYRMIQPGEFTVEQADHYLRAMYRQAGLLPSPPQVSRSPS